MENTKIDELFAQFEQDEEVTEQQEQNVQLQSDASDDDNNNEQSNESTESTDEQQKSPEQQVQEEVDDYDFFADAGIELEEGDSLDINEETTLTEIAQRVKTYVDKIKSEKEEYDDEVKDFINFKKIGGSLEEFRQAPRRIEYDKIAEQLNDENFKDSENIVRIALQRKDLPNDVIDTAINTFKDKGELVNQAKNILLKENEVNKKEYEDWIANINEQNKKIKEENDNYIKDVKNTVDSGKFAGIVLSKQEISNFNDFILKVDSNTKSTKAAEKYSKLTVEQQLFLDYIVFNDFDLRKIQKTDKVETKPIVKRVGNIGGKVPKVKLNDDDKQWENDLNSIIDKYK